MAAVTERIIPMSPYRLLRNAVLIQNNYFPIDQIMIGVFRTYFWLFLVCLCGKKVFDLLLSFTLLSVCQYDRQREGFFLVKKQHYIMDNYGDRKYGYTSENVTTEI